MSGLEAALAVGRNDLQFRTGEISSIEAER
jgi:hypothetical protein